MPTGNRIEDDIPNDHLDDEESDVESKSQRKRNAHQITALAGKLVAMKARPLARLPIEPATLEAIQHCAEIKAHGARKRQLHYVSKLLRDADNIEELQSMVDNPDLVPAKKKTVNPHIAFRDQLLQDFALHVDELRESYPNVDLQQVRQLVRNAQKESEPKDPETDKSVKIEKTKSGKALLQLLADFK